MTLLMKIPMEMKETYLTIENKGVFRRGFANKTVFEIVLSALVDIRSTNELTYGGPV